MSALVLVDEQAETLDALPIEVVLGEEPAGEVVRVGDPSFEAAIAEMRRAVNAVFVDDKIKGYILDIVFASRDPDEAGLDLAPLIAWGASPRATLALTQLARAEFALGGGLELALACGLLGALVTAFVGCETPKNGTTPRERRRAPQTRQTHATPSPSRIKPSSRCSVPI